MIRLLHWVPSFVFTLFLFNYVLFVLDSYHRLQQWSFPDDCYLYTVLEANQKSRLCRHHLASRDDHSDIIHGSVIVSEVPSYATPVQLTKFVNMSLHVQIQC